MIVRILTPWIGDGITMQTAFRPKLLNDYPLEAEATCKDITGADPKNGGAFVVKISGVSQTWVDEVSADPTYIILGD